MVQSQMALIGTVSTKSKNEDLPALTGIRFVAAISILLNHLLLHIFPAGEYPQLAPALRGSGVLGMNLFFILSGFIIHYNYGRTLRILSPRPYFDFFAARIARLYPLFIIFFAYEFCTEDYILTASETTRGALLSALPRFVTMSQTWAYGLINNSTSVAYSYANSSITWSISTEFMMYGIYPLILLTLLPEKDSTLLRIMKFTIGTALVSFGMKWLINHPEVPDAFGIKHYGATAGFEANPVHSFAFWLLFLSPYMRIFEFLIGAFCAHLFVSRAKNPIETPEKIVISGLSSLSVLVIAATYLPTQFHLAWVDSLFTWLGYYPFLAILIYSAARWQSGWTSRAFAWRPLVWCGDASYSIYLIHIVVYNKFGHHSENLLASTLRAFASIALIILIARILYEWVEMPMRKWMRNKLTIIAPGLSVRPRTT